MEYVEELAEDQHRDVYQICASSPFCVYDDDPLNGFEIWNGLDFDAYPF